MLVFRNYTGKKFNLAKIIFKMRALLKDWQIALKLRGSPAEINGL